MADVPPPFVPGAFVGAAHHYRARIYFEDTDLSGIVYHANYLRYMERARSDMLRVSGIDQRAAAEQGLGHYAVSQVDIRYRAPARLDDALLVRSRVREVGAARCVIAEVNAGVPFTHGATLRLADVDAWVQSDQPVVDIPASKTGTHLRAFLITPQGEMKSFPAWPLCVEPR